MRLNGIEVEIIGIRQELVEGVGRYATTVRVNKRVNGKAFMKIEDSGFPELDGKEVYLLNRDRYEYGLTYLMPPIDFKIEAKMSELEIKKRYDRVVDEVVNKASKYSLSLEEIKELIAYGEVQWDESPFNRGFLHGLKEALKRMEGEA